MIFDHRSLISIVFTICQLFDASLQLPGIGNCREYDERNVHIYYYQRSVGVYVRVNSSNMDELTMGITKMMIHGHNQNVTMMEPIYSGYVKTLDVTNIFLVDWSAYAYCETLFDDRIRKIGKTVSKFILKLTERDFKEEQIHIIAFGSGSDIAGIASRHLQVKRVSRISALESVARSELKEDNQIHKGDAEFIDEIHTSGISRLGDVGDVIFVVNHGIIQPGCADEGMDDCSHKRAIIYYGESINSVMGFYGRKCDMADFHERKNHESEMELMGAYTSPKARGTYCVKTNDEYPYARGKIDT